MFTKPSIYHLLNQPHQLIHSATQLSLQSTSPSIQQLIPIHHPFTQPITHPPTDPSLIHPPTRPRNQLLLREWVVACLNTVMLRLLLLCMLLRILFACDSTPSTASLPNVVPVLPSPFFLTW
ncbi:hypothetical protein E2C01_088527 [Portunus trituberculatus]|uniref:Uncharacterized protein n=1 Tax=Portunus trituberculatus TaxID=210409 RepID=A0A5B7J6F4_PORTR|nr:hypothetical protein [Portunus trituberculatus]